MLSKLKTMIKNRSNRKSLYCTSEYWDTKAHDYKQSAVSMWANTILNDHYKDELVEIIDSLNLNYNELNVLDLGCGTGNYSRWFAAKGARVKGLDFSAEAIQIAETNNINNNITYQIASIFDINETSKYDFIFLSALITIACKNSDEVTSVLKKIKPLFTDNGQLLLCEPIHKGFLSRVLNINIKQFINIMVYLGFKIQFIKSIHFYPIRLLLCYFPLPKLITTPLFYFGKFLNKLPLLSNLGDYWCISATLKE